MGLSEAAVESTLFRARRNLAHEYVQIGTGRRCTAVGVSMERVSAGTANDRDRAKVARHARRCGPCRRRALALGVEPAPSRAAALVPALGLVRQQSAGGLGAVFTPAAPGLVAKAVSAIAAGAVVAGGGAGLGGVGPLALPDPATPSVIERDAAPAGPGGRSGQTPPAAPTVPRQSRPGAERKAPAPGSVKDLPGGGSVPAAPLGTGLPEVTVPEVKVPDVTVPDVRVPEVSLPKPRLGAPAVPGLHDVPAVDAASLEDATAAEVRGLHESATSLLP
jgi:hypothetical protein